MRKEESLGGRGDEEFRSHGEEPGGQSGERVHRFLHLAHDLQLPPATDKMIEGGFTRFAQLWNPILDVFDDAASGSHSRCIPRRSPLISSRRSARSRP